MHYGIEDATHPYTCIPLLSLSLFPSFSRLTRKAFFAVALSCPSNISDLFGPLHFFSYAASSSPLCRRGTLVSHHFPDKSALYSFILLHSDGFLTRGTRIRTKPGDARCSIGETTAGWIRERRPPSRIYTPRVSRILFSRDPHSPTFWAFLCVSKYIAAEYCIKSTYIKFFRVRSRHKE